MGFKKGTKVHKWSNEEKEYLKSIVKGNHYDDIKRKMTERFEYNYGTTQIAAAIKRYNLSTGFDGRFKKGHVPSNKGKKRIYCKSWYKKGNTPCNYKQIGSERITARGYVEVKTEHPNKWELKQRVVYKREKGDIPRNCVVVFCDGNKLNFNIENLALVTRNQLKIMNAYKLITNDIELTKTGMLLANVLIKMSEKRSVKK